MTATAQDPTMKDRKRNQAQATIVLLMSVVTFFLSCISAIGASRYVGEPGNDAKLVLVFVHGFLGDSKQTWSNETDKAKKVYWPELVVADDSQFEDIDVYVYEYKSSGTRLDPSIAEVTQNMYLTLKRHKVFEYSEIAFVAHSMGGIVVRDFLKTYLFVAQKVRFLYFLGTPTSGVDTVISRLVRYFRRSSQLRQLIKARNSYLNDQILGWQSSGILRKLPSYCGYERHGTKWIGVIVEMPSAALLCSRRVMPIEGDHFQIAKPAGRETDSYWFLLEAYQETKQTRVLCPCP